MKSGLIRTLLLLSLVLMFSSTAVAEGLLQVYQIALNSDPVLKQYVSRYQSVKEGREQSFASFLPSISASAGASETRSTGYSNTSSSNYASKTYDLSLRQSIYDNKNYVSHRISRLNLSSATADLTLAQQDLISRVINAYLDVLFARDSVEFTKTERKAIAKQLEQAKRRYEVGIIAITAVLNAQAGYDSANAAVLKAENEYQLARERLRDIAGQYFPSLSALKENIPLEPPKPNDIEAWVKTALENNPSLQSTRFKVQSSRENIELQRAGHYPTFDLYASYSGLDKDGPFDTFIRNGSDTTIGVEMKLPIYQGGLISSKTRQAQYDYEDISNRLEEIRRTTERQTRNSFLSVVAEISRVKALKQAVISNDSALEATQAGYEVGSRTIVDILNVQRDRFDAKLNYSQARYNYIRSLVLLKQSAGVLSLEDVEKLDKWFE